jgi:hypothetical protein
MSVRVVSKRKGGDAARSDEVVINIARPSILGNPFAMLHEGQRTDVINKYRDWLRLQFKGRTAVRAEVERIAALVKAGKPIALQCWCAPCACHGDVIIEAIKGINK